ncbi:MAG: hypothetical protein HQL69_05710 [Magnetococcales bacterium]|nr:hypothetical protein [Magnetococcales bacterium]
MFDSNNKEDELQKKIVRKEMQQIMEELEASFPLLKSKVGAFTGAGFGTASAIGATSFAAGASVNLAGIKSGLLLLGSLAGGSMAVGMAMLTAPAAAFSFFGYHMLKSRNRNTLKQAYLVAIEEYRNLYGQIIDQEQLFHKEITAIDEIITALEESLQELK